MKFKLQKKQRFKLQQFINKIVREVETKRTRHNSINILLNKVLSSFQFHFSTFPRGLFLCFLGKNFHPVKPVFNSILAVLFFRYTFFFVLYPIGVTVSDIASN